MLSLAMKKYISFSYFAAFFCLGLCLASLGPALLDLAAQTDSDIQSIGSIFAFRAVGYLTGSSLGGFLFEVINGNYLLSCSAFVCMLGTFFIPFSKSLGVLCFCVLLQGFAMGFLDTGGNLLLLRLHAEPDPSASEPYMQAMHFSFALGALAIPLVMSALNNLTVSFITIAILLLVVFFNFTFVSLKFKDAKYAVPRKSGGGGEIKEGKTVTFWTRQFKEKLICIFAGLLLFVYVGAETTYGGLLYTYTHNLAWTDKDGKGVTAIYWGGLALGRALAIPLSTKFSPNKMLAIDLVGCLICSLILVSSKSDAVIWSMSFFHGLCYASIFPAVLNAAALCVNEMDGISTSVIIVGASIGDMTIPAFAAFLVVTFGMEIFPIVILSCSIGCCLFFLGMAGFGMYYNKRRDSNSSVLGGKDVEIVNQASIVICTT